MVNKTITGATCACLAVVSLSANAALIGRDFDGDLSTAEAYYDDVANLTWLADANYAMTSGYDADGHMYWGDANAWAADLTVDDVGGWRLPDTLQPDASCDNQNGSFSSGYNCTGSEMGNLFYNVLGGSAHSSIATTHNANYDLFDNVQPNIYWSATESSPTTAGVSWAFDMRNGFQGIDGQNLVSLYAWAVQSGSVGTEIVPIPATVWLFGSGLLGLIAVARKKVHV